MKLYRRISKTDTSFGVKYGDIFTENHVLRRRHDGSTLTVGRHVAEGSENWEFIADVPENFIILCNSADELRKAIDWVLKNKIGGCELATGDTDYFSGRYVNLDYLTKKTDDVRERTMMDIIKDVLYELIDSHVVNINVRNINPLSEAQISFIYEGTEHLIQITDEEATVLSIDDSDGKMITSICNIASNF